MSEKRQVLVRKLLQHINRKPYLTYRMVPCLVTLIDIYTRRAALSASAELLVTCATLAGSLLSKDVWMSVCPSHAGIVSKRLNLP